MFYTNLVLRSSYYMKYVFLITTLLFLNSCSGSIYNNNSPFFKGTFLKVEKIVKIRACNPKNPKQCITKKYGSSASSFLVGHKGNFSYLLTSAHVCETNFGKLIFLPNFESIINFYGVDLNENEHPFYIVSMDHLNDLCLVATPRIKMKSYKIAKRLPRLGDKVYNISSPTGIFGKDVVPLFSGYYSGKVHNRLIFSLPATGGSSGSPILNKRGEVIGVVSAVTKNFKNLIIASKLKAIKEIIKDGI